MLKTCYNLLIFAFALNFLGCESKKSYDIGNDQAISDLNSRITLLTEDLNTLDEELKDVKKVLEDPDIDGSVRASIRREVHEGDKHRKDIVHWISYLKIQRKKRYQSLLDRKGQDDLREQAEQEVRAYFVQKKLNPIDKKWKDRYRTAIEL